MSVHQSVYANVSAQISLDRFLQKFGIGDFMKIFQENPNLVEFRAKISGILW
jgi:hypothetical protein